MEIINLWVDVIKQAILDLKEDDFRLKKKAIIFLFIDHKEISRFNEICSNLNTNSDVFRTKIIREIIVPGLKEDTLTFKTCLGNCDYTIKNYDGFYYSSRKTRALLNKYFIQKNEILKEIERMQVEKKRRETYHLRYQLIKMTIKDFLADINEFKKKGCPMDLDNTNIIGIRDTNRGLETAAIVGFGYNAELDSWFVEVKDWEKGCVKK